MNSLKLFISLLACLSLVQTGLASAGALSTLSPTPTYKACHICEEEDLVPLTETLIPKIEATHQQEPVVHGVLLWMDGCPHCHEVLNNVLPPLKEKYGQQLDIQPVEVATTEEVADLYRLAETYGIPKENVGVPFMVIGDQVLLGSDEISQKLPPLIETYLTKGGADLPSNPILDDMLSRSDTLSETEPTVQNEPLDAATNATEKLQPTQSNGFGLAVGVMVFMIATLLYAFLAFVWEKLPVIPASWTERLLPVLALVGFVVALYLAYVETQSVRAICGPVGDCNAVQSSPYAYLFGVLPIGVLGLIGYLVILAAWLYPRLRADRLAQLAPLAVFGMTFFGVLFSLYLTYLEPFVIRAVCIWCLTSSVTMTLTLLVSLPPAIQALGTQSTPDEEKAPQMI